MGLLNCPVKLSAVHLKMTSYQLTCVGSEKKPAGRQSVRKYLDDTELPTSWVLE